MRLVLIFATLLSIVSCQSVPAKFSAQSNVDGKWVLKKYECLEGELTEAAQAINRNLGNGSSSDELIKSGSSVVQLFNNGKCEYKIIETWEIHDLEVTVSGSKATTVKKDSSSNVSCTPYANLKPRTHQIFASNNELKITLQKDYRATLGGNAILGNLCSKGAETLVYLRN